jgi:nitroreductase
MIGEIIKKRSAVYPKSYNGSPISRETILELLDYANRAPSHRKTEPWRFGVFYSEEARERLAEFLASDYKTQNAGPGFSDFKCKKILKKPAQSAAVLAIILKRDEEERVPEWEEIAAVSMSVQNIWLACTEKNIGCYWSSPSAMTQRATEFLSLKPGERCLGLLYMGNIDNPEIKDKEIGSIHDKIYWL